MRQKQQNSASSLPTSVNSNQAPMAKAKTGQQIMSIEEHNSSQSLIFENGSGSKTIAKQQKSCVVEQISQEQLTRSIEVCQDFFQESEIEILNDKIGTWEAENAGDIESYLVGIQRKFVKYRLNIFVLNKSALRLQHFFHKRRLHRQYLLRLETQKQNALRIATRSAQISLVQTSEVDDVSQSKQEQEQELMRPSESSIVEYTTTNFQEGGSSLTAIEQQSFSQQNLAVAGGPSQETSTTVTETVTMGNTSARKTKMASYMSATSSTKAKSTSGVHSSKKSVNQTVHRQTGSMTSEDTILANAQLNKSTPHFNSPDAAATAATTAATTTATEKKAVTTTTTSTVGKAGSGKKEVSGTKIRVSMAGSRKGSPSYRSQVSGRLSATTNVQEVQVESKSARMSHGNSSGSKTIQSRTPGRSTVKESQSSSKNSVTKTVGGTTTTTVTTTTTTYMKNGKVVGKSKSIDKKIAAKPSKTTTTTTTTGGSNRLSRVTSTSQAIQKVEISPQISSKAGVQLKEEIQDSSIFEVSATNAEVAEAQVSNEECNGQINQASVIHSSLQNLPVEECCSSDVQIMTMEVSESQKDQTVKSSLSSNMEMVDENIILNSEDALKQLTRGSQNRHEELESMSRKRSKKGSRTGSITKATVDSRARATLEVQTQEESAQAQTTQEESASFYQNSKDLMVSQQELIQEQSSQMSRASLGAKSEKSKTTRSRGSGQKQARKQTQSSVGSKTKETTSAKKMAQTSACKNSLEKLSPEKVILESSDCQSLLINQRQSEHAQSQQLIQNNVAPCDQSNTITAMTSRPTFEVGEKQENTDLQTSKSSVQKDIIRKAFENKLKAEEKLRSVSQLSSRSTFSMEQKKVGWRQNLNPTMISAKSTTRFQERQDRKSRDQRHEWKDLQKSSTTKSKLTSEEREALMQRQEQSMSRLLQPTRSSQLKVRARGESARDQSPDEAALTLNSSRSHQQLRLDKPVGGDSQSQLHSTTKFSKVEVIPEFAQTKASRTSAVTNRDGVKRTGLQSKSAQKWTNNYSRNDNKIISVTSTTKSSFVSAKGDTTTDVITMKTHARSAVKTPRVIHNKSNLKSCLTLQDESPIRNRSRSGLKMQSSYNTATTSITQQGKAQTKTKSKTFYQTSKQNSSSSMLQQKESERHQMSPVKSSKSQKSRSSIQAGGNEYTGQYVSEEKSIEDQIIIQEVEQIAPSTSTLQRQSKGKHTQSITAMSNSSYQMNSSRNSVKVLPETPGSRAVKTTTTVTTGRGIPQASKQRASVRRQKESQQVDETTFTSQKSHTLLSSQKQKSVEINRKSFGTSSRKSNLQGPKASSKAKIVREEQYQIMSEETKTRPANQVEYAGSSTVFMVQSEEKRDVNNIQSEDYEHDLQTDQVVVQKERGFSFDKTQEQEMFPTFGSDTGAEEKGYRTLQQSPIKESEQLEIYDTNRHSHRDEEKEISFSNASISVSQQQFYTQYESMPTVLETQFQADTKGHLQKCLLEDLALSKIQKSFRQEFTLLKEVLQKEYHRINAVFLFYVGQSHTYPALSEEDFLSFAVECNLVQETSLDQEALVKCFQETIVSTNNLKKSGESILYRYEFIEVIVRIAASLLKQQSGAATQTGALAKRLQSLLTDVILRNARSVNRYKFRKLLIQDTRVALLLNANHEVIELAYGYFTHERKSYVALEECVALARQCQLDISDPMVGIIFAESQETVLNSLKNKERMYQLNFPEFVYFLCRLTKEHFEDTEYAAEEFYIKLDNLLAFLLEPFDLTPRFRFKATFEVDIKTAKYRSLTVVQNEYLDEKIGSTRVNVTTRTQQVRTSSDNAATDGDIQAWPQPCPIAYPQRQEFNRGVSPSVSNPKELSSIKNSSEVHSQSTSQIEDHSVQVTTGRRHKTMITQQRTKVRSYLSSAKKQQQQQKR